MRLVMSSCVGVSTGAALASMLVANVTLDPFFRDSAVLAADRPITVTGTAVTVDSGRWRATLPAQPASGTPRDLVAMGSSVATAKDVVAGDLWIVAGQTNVALALSASTDGAATIARYGEQSIPSSANLINGAGLPASSFQTDEFVDAPKKSR